MVISTEECLAEKLSIEVDCNYWSRVLWRNAF